MSSDAISSPRRVPARTIKAALRKAGYRRLEDFAVAIGKSKGAVSMVIAGDMKSAYIAKRIAEVVGKPASTIWPRLYPAA